jgi:hypothetical protein
VYKYKDVILISAVVVKNQDGVVSAVLNDGFGQVEAIVHEDHVVGLTGEFEKTAKPIPLG